MSCFHPKSCTILGRTTWNEGRERERERERDREREGGVEREGERKRNGNRSSSKPKQPSILQHAFYIYWERFFSMVNNLQCQENGQREREREREMETEREKQVE